MEKKFKENTNEFIDEVSEIFKTKKRTKEILKNFFNKKIEIKDDNNDYRYFLELKNRIKKIISLNEKYPNLTYQITKNPKKKN
jgi:hypothetical protein